MNRGSFLLSRLANYFPDLFTKLAFLDVGYAAPGHGLTAETVQFVNRMVKDSKGFEVFGYFLFFDEEGAAELMDEHVSTSLSHFCFLSLLEFALNVGNGYWVTNDPVTDSILRSIRCSLSCIRRIMNWERSIWGRQEACGRGSARGRLLRERNGLNLR